jgi:hypothetical protein
MTELNVAVRGEFDFQSSTPFTGALSDLGFRQCDVLPFSASSLSHSLYARLRAGEALWGVHPTDLKVVLVHLPSVSGVTLRDGLALRYGV